MKQLLKRVCSVLLCALTVCAALSMYAAAENQYGSLGDHISWTYNTIRHDLTVSGDGPMEDYERSPFWGLRNDVTKVIIQGGITHIGDYAFYYLQKLTSVRIECNVQSVGKYAFSSTALSSIILPDSVRSIGDNAFTSCSDAVHIPRFTKDIGENILYSKSTTAYICSTTEDCYAKKYADAHGYTFEVCTHSEHTHNYERMESIAPTDTEIGTDTYSCSVCGESYTMEFPIVGHSTEHKTEEATCTQDGREYDLCTVCGRELNVVKTAPAAGHQYDAEITVDPTCTEDGERTYTCSICGDSYTEPVEAAGHQYVDTVVEPTVLEGGYTTHTCMICGDSYTDSYTDPLAHAHRYISSVTQQPTCTAKGERTYTCSVCGDSYTEEIDMLEHSLQHKTEAASCTKDGSEYDECTVCGEKVNEKAIAAVGHKYDAKVTAAPTCTEKGERTYTCSVCGDSYTEEIEVNGHSLQHKVEAATCTENGSEYEECTVCGNRFNTQILTAAGHKYEARVTSAPTCTAKGERTYTCTVCGGSYTEEIDTLAHSLQHRTEAATCTENGREYDICTVCGETTHVRVLPAAHRFVDGVCTVCGILQDWRYTLRADDSAEITAYLGAQAMLYIPAALQGHPVTAIGDMAFAGNSTVVYVSIPDSVTEIGNYAFADCPTLQEAFVGEHVATIRADAFSHCPALSNVCFAGKGLTLQAQLFSGANSRLTVIAPADSQTERSARASGLRCIAYTYPKEKDGKNVLAFSGSTTLYADLLYGYWVELVDKYPETYYLYFDALTIDGINPADLGDDLDAQFVEKGAHSVTFKTVYVSVKVEGRTVTFRRLMELLREGKGDLAISFDDGKGQHLTIFQKIGGFVLQVFNALTKLLQSLLRIFRR